MPVALSDNEIEQHFMNQVLALDVLGQKVTSVCPFCGQETTIPGSDCHRACWDSASLEARSRVLDIQIKVRALPLGLPLRDVKVAMLKFGYLCRNCGTIWTILEKGWECPGCVNV